MARADQPVPAMTLMLAGWSSVSLTVSPPTRPTRWLGDQELKTKLVYFAQASPSGVRRQAK